ncbi:RNA pseudouridine synthase [Idiomarina tyrosinivorans]|uniref:Dual-specificity RNA pseudouridine synthase RluA n=1 Tax=Idiomarina tyrosinivorans TaxID=1445662 RepID=A0A432ZRZ2_9GAMM|nr:pseudouridine synthase [Idiomarina tyrosinivorans]RUO80695.1 RNA pseudouridine synthase [Idiomarina tyrosinivorans]
MTDRPFVYSPPQTPYLDIVYRDDALVVVNKPSGLLSVPGKQRIHYDSVYTRLQRVMPDIRLIHRLDMATSGLIVFAIGKPAQSHLSRQFQQRQVRKQYVADVWGQLPASQGVIDLPMKCDWPNRPRQHLDFSAGKAAQTWYRVEKPMTADIQRVKLYPHTGRSHQLRVHMQALNTPIIGDKFYAHESAYQAAQRLHLHAERIQLCHPVSEHPLDFYLPAPF